MTIGVKLKQERIAAAAVAERRMKIRMSAESERHRILSGVANSRAQPQSITYFVVYFEYEGPMPYSVESRMLGGVEYGLDKVGSAALDSERLLAGKSVNCISARRFVYRQTIFVAVEYEPGIRDAAGPGK